MSNGFLALKRIIETIFDIFTLSPKEAREKYDEFPNFAEQIAKLFQEDRLFEIPERLNLQLEIVKSFSPKVRPALDPYTSLQIGVFNKNFSDWEIGRFLNYPECCIRSFIEEIRYGFDERHLNELKTLSRDCIFITTAGFIPHSIFCEKSIETGLASIIKYNELLLLEELEEELAKALPHSHPEYWHHYYDVLKFDTSHIIFGRSSKDSII
ncbi:MAG: DUF483 domain-containing protein [Candidatus Methanomethyliaceae archaeon]|nr:DUF483 domain-containing protein [Candidatus Methanomethyliaceae archaeon]MDW7970835.1 DUF483 domain-containing protein [Nitrososphaerota archaeon]